MGQPENRVAARNGAEPTTDGQYTSTFAGKGAYLSDAKLVLEKAAYGQNIDTLRKRVIDEDMLDRRTWHNREKVWKEIFRRYMSGRDPDHITTMAKMVTGSSNPATANLVLFYEYCQVDHLLYDLTACCTYGLYQNARLGINKVDVNEWLAEREADHPEIAGWSLATRNRLISSYLATIRDFGLVTGIKRKEFHKLYVPREAFVYALYHQKARGIAGKALIQSADWRLFLLSEDEVTTMLEDAARGGFVHFQRAGDIVDLRFIYTDLAEVVDAIVS